MRISVIEDPLIEDIEIKIFCKEKNSYVDKLVNCLSENEVILVGTIDNEKFKLSSKEIYYFESVDNRTYIYTENKVYKSDLKLYELEDKLFSTKFTRINKACILNLDKLQKVQGQLNGRLLATLYNGEKLIINRSYVQEIKQKLRE
ncbi:LytTR family DNA-binding domain-containing protein [Clostridium manihotivorum]|nr:LytTR family DNA-binding domain-containing protein [Clostridium manihotivorum]